MAFWPLLMLSGQPWDVSASPLAWTPTAATSRRAPSLQPPFLIALGFSLPLTSSLPLPALPPGGDGAQRSRALHINNRNLQQTNLCGMKSRDALKLGWGGMCRAECGPAVSWAGPAPSIPPAKRLLPGDLGVSPSVGAGAE